MRYRHTRTVRREGFTLVEVMVAAAVATIALLALLGTAFISYKINHKARLRDNARAVLRTYVDQFQRLAYSTDEGVIRVLFSPTTGETGRGMRWGELSDEPNDPTFTDDPAKIDIGPPGSEQWAYVTREVSYVSLTDGQPITERKNDAAGFMLKATFTITYTLAGSKDQAITQNMSTLRLIDQ